MAMDDADIRNLVIANRILADGSVLDAYGHVSLRNPNDPTRFLLSRSRSAELVAMDDIMEFHLDGSPVHDDGRALYVERFIHAAFYAARDDVEAVVHGHTEELLPFGITDTPLQAVIHSASDLGSVVPVWDMREMFGENTNLLVTNLGEAEDLVRCLGESQAVLMRGHGFACGARSLRMTVRLCIYLARNARVQLAAQAMGPINGLSRGECEARRAYFKADSPEVLRGWECWAIRAGCEDLLGVG